MSEWILLGLVAAGLYLFECLAWIAATAVACVRAPARRRWTCASGTSLPGSERGGLVFSDPLTIRGNLVVCRQWPLAVSPEGVAGPVSFGDAAASPEPVHYHRFDAITSVSAVLDEIRINDERFMRVDSSAAAIHLAERIQHVSRVAASKRAAAIRAAVRDSLDRRAAARAWARFLATSAPLRWCATGLAIFTFVAAPLVLALLGPYPAWMYLLASLAVATLATVIAYVRAHAALYRECRYDRWVHALSMILLPVSAIRGIDKLSRDALTAYSPAVVLPLLCGTDTATPLLRALYVDLQRAQPAEDAGTATAACITWFRDLLAAEMAAAFDREGVKVQAPPAAQPAMETYCPRCHAQFGQGGGGTCPDCAVEVVRF